MVLKMDMEELTARREKIHQKIKEVIKEIGGITTYDPRCVSGYALIVAIFELLLEENGVPLEKDNNDGVDLTEENQNSPEKITETEERKKNQYKRRLHETILVRTSRKHPTQRLYKN